MQIQFFLRNFLSRLKYARIVSCVFCPDNEVKQNNIPKKKAIEPLFIENVVLLFIRYIFEYIYDLCIQIESTFLFTASMLITDTTMNNTTPMLIAAHNDPVSSCGNNNRMLSM